MASYTGDSGNPYSFGPCFEDGEQKPYGYRALWTNPEGKQLRATYEAQGKELGVEYLTMLGWVTWTKETGISLAGR